MYKKCISLCREMTIKFVVPTKMFYFAPHITSAHPMEHTYWICLGSNHEPHTHIPKAQAILKQLFPNIRFAPEEETSPIGINSSAMFVNQVALFRSSLSIDEIKAQLKQTETYLGRRPEHKITHLICIDIDLLRCDGQILKPNDWQRDYVQRGLKHV